MNLVSTINQMERTMEYQAENTVSSFFYYMWNAWSEEECKAVYGNMYPHFWEKWCVATDKGTFGAAERFYLELSEDNRRLLVERAVSIYDGRGLRTERNIKNQTACRENIISLISSSCGCGQTEAQEYLERPEIRIPARIAGGGRPERR